MGCINLDLHSPAAQMATRRHDIHVYRSCAALSEVSAETWEKQATVHWLNGDMDAHRDAVAQVRKFKKDASQNRAKAKRLEKMPAPR